MVVVVAVARFRPVSGGSDGPPPACAIREHTVFLRSGPFAVGRGPRDKPPHRVDQRPEGTQQTGQPFQPGRQWGGGVFLVFFVGASRQIPESNGTPGFCFGRMVKPPPVPELQAEHRCPLEKLGVGGPP